MRNPQILAAEQQAQADPIYRSLLRRLRKAEDRLSKLEESMTDEQREAVWDFYGLIEDVNNRFIEIILENRI